MALAGLGGWIRYKSKDYDTILGAKGLETPANLLIAAGAVIFLVAFFGFCGAWMENKCLLQLVSISFNELQFFKMSQFDTKSHHLFGKENQR